MFSFIGKISVTESPYFSIRAANQLLISNFLNQNLNSPLNILIL